MLKKLILSLALFASVQISADETNDAFIDSIFQTGTLPQGLEWKNLEKPFSPGPSISDRNAWDNFPDKEWKAKILSRADEYLKQPIPPFNDELYMEFYSNGNRRNWERSESARVTALSCLFLAECFKADGTKIAKIEEYIKSICEEKSWLAPAHDSNAATYKGKSIDIDLSSATKAYSFAVIYNVLGDKLSSETRALMSRNVRTRVLDPYLEALSGKRKKWWWMQCTNNWNAVCHAGVLGSALVFGKDKEEKLIFIASAIANMKYYLSGFTPDGYCSEGVGYWNYGFEHFLAISESVRVSSGDVINLMRYSKAVKPSEFGFTIKLTDKLSPAFADCGLTAMPDRRLCGYITAISGVKSIDFRSVAGGDLIKLYMSVLYAYPFVTMPSEQSELRLPARTYFQDAGILICRSSELKDLGAAFKGGNNAEHHNHNDIGSFVIAAGEGLPFAADPGSEVYTKRTFSKDRYDSKLLSSYGHSVPVVAGKLQKTGAEAAAKVLKADFNAQLDVFMIDIKSAYDVPALEKLSRTFIFERESPAVYITDEVVFTEESSFEEAVITFFEPEILENKEGILLSNGSGKKIRMKIDAGGLTYTIKTERIEEDISYKSKPYRIAIKVDGPYKKYRVSLRFLEYK